jgi:hypothetical protein
MHKEGLAWNRPGSRPEVERRANGSCERESPEAHWVGGEESRGERKSRKCAVLLIKSLFGGNWSLERP